MKKIFVQDKATFKTTARTYDEAGFLHVPGRVSKTGTQQYLRKELGLDGDPYAGMVVDAQANNSVSKVNKSGATAPWGVFVARDGDDGFTTVAAGADATDIIGVLRRELNRAQVDGATGGAPEDRDASVLTTGTIYVHTTGAVNQGDPVHVVPGGANAGKATATATDNVAIAGAKFIETTTGAGIAAVSLVIGG